MSGTREEGEGPRGERRDDRHVLRIGADDAFGDPNQEIDAAGGVHHRRGHDDREDDQHHVDRRRRRVDAERHDQHQQSDGAPQAEADARVAGAHPDRGEHDDELQKMVSVMTLLLPGVRAPLNYCSNFGAIRFSNEKTSSHFSCVSSLRSLTTMSCSDLPVS